MARSSSRTPPPGTRYAAFLRGISPSNCSMPALARCFEAAGMRDVRTVLSSGNVVFAAPAPADLEAQLTAAMQTHLGKVFLPILRRIDELEALLRSDPYGAAITPAAKRVVSFLVRAPARGPKLPVSLDGATIVSRRGAEVFTVYEPSPRGPAFMVLIEKTFGKDVTTRTWATVEKVVRAATEASRAREPA